MTELAAALIHGQQVVLASVDVQQNFLQPILTGLLQGCVYGLIGLGVVLLYKANGIFNFAQGEFGSIAALTANAGLMGTFGFHMPYPLAMLCGLIAGTLTAVLTERIVIRPLSHRPKVDLTVATVGVLLFLNAMETLAVKRANNFPGFSTRISSFNKRGYLFKLFGYRVLYEQALCAVVLVLLALATVYFFKRTDTGTAILAVSQERTAASTVGISVDRISLITWGIAGLIGASAGVLLGPILTPIAPGFVTGTALFTGFTAAVLGGITSLQGVFVGGLAIGVLEKLTNPDNLAAYGVPNIPGIDQVAVGLALLLVLLVRPAGLFGKET